MTSASLFEQLTGSVSPSMMTVGSVATLALIIVFTVVFRLFFTSSTKSKSTSSSKQVSNKEKKGKETSGKKQQQPEVTTSAKKKKNNNQTKKNANATPPPPVESASSPSSSSSSSSSSQSEESEDEKAVVAPSKKQASTSNKTTTGKKGNVNDENNKATNGIKTPTKQQNSARTENTADAAQGADKKKKPAKGNPTPAPTKQAATGKNDATNKVNVNTSNKKQAVVVNSENQRGPVDVEAGSDQEDDGQWVTQGGKQVNSRNRNKAKVETSTVNTQEVSTTSNRKTGSDKRTVPTSTNNNTSSSTKKTENDIDLPEVSTVPAASVTPTPEPIEICQLLPAGEDRYTANDNWWKQALNKQQTFSVDDIGEWPERDQDEQYTVQKRIIPVKAKALTEKDINIDGNDEINTYKNGRDDEKFNFDNQTISSSGVAGEGKTGPSQSKKRTANVRRLS